MYISYIDTKYKNTVAYNKDNFCGYKCIRKTHILPCINGFSKEDFHAAKIIMDIAQEDM